MSLYPPSYPYQYPYQPYYPPNFPQYDPTLDAAKKKRGKVFALCTLVGTAIIGYIVVNYLLFALARMIFGINLTSNPLIYQSVSLIIQMASILVPFSMLSLLGKKYKSYDPLPSKRVKPGLFITLIFIGLGVTFAGMYASGWLSSFFELIGLGYSYPNEAIPTNPYIVFLWFISYVVVPAFCEEYAIRGVLIGLLKPYGEGFAVVSSALVFGLLHLNMTQAPFAVVMGLITGCIVVYTGNIWITVVIHAIINLTSTVTTYFYDLNPDLINVIYDCFFYGVMLIGGILLVTLLARRKGFLAPKKPDAIQKNTHPFRYLIASPTLIICFLIFLVYSFAIMGN